MVSYTGGTHTLSSPAEDPCEPPEPEPEPELPALPEPAPDEPDGPLP